MTLGSKGVAYAENGAINTVPAFKVQAVDTTGAGDTFQQCFRRCTRFRQNHVRKHYFCQCGSRFIRTKNRRAGRNALFR